MGKGDKKLVTKGMPPENFRCAKCDGEIKMVMSYEDGETLPPKGERGVFSPRGPGLGRRVRKSHWS